MKTIIIIIAISTIVFGCITFKSISKQVDSNTSRIETIINYDGE